MTRRYNSMLDQYEYLDAPELGKRDEFCISALNESKIDPTVDAEKPKIIFSVRERVATSFEDRRVCTLGNFSTFIGKPKSKKTYLLSAICAAVISKRLMWDKFKGYKHEGKDLVLLFDTEQGRWDSLNVVRRIITMAGISDKFRAYNLRPYSPKDRVDIIDYALGMYGNECGFAIVDGVADLVKSINDEEEASNTVTKLMQWTDMYNMHIATVIHQNKADFFATGHLGSYVTKKSEIVISVTKDNDSESTVQCNDSRGMWFNPFKMYVNGEGMPVIDNISIQVDNNDFERINNDEPF